MKPFSDEEIIHAIQIGGRTAEAVLEQLYRDAGYRHMAAAAARLFNGDSADVDDLVQEGLWRVYRKIREGAFEERSTIKTFFGSVVKNIALNEYTTLRRRATLLSGMPMPQDASTTELGSVVWKEKMEQLDKVFSALPAGCKQLLELWGDGYSLNEIESKMGFPNLDAVKNKKKNCLKSLREWMLRHPEVAKWFNEK